MLDYLFCVQENASPIWTLLVDSAQMTLGAVMCLLVVIQFIREVHQMYKVTEHFRLNRYMNILVWEGTIYFLVYVNVSSCLPFPLLCN